MATTLKNRPSTEEQINEDCFIVPVKSLESLKFHALNENQPFQIEKKKHEHFGFKKVSKNKRKIVILTIELTYKIKK